MAAHSVKFRRVGIIRRATGSKGIKVIKKVLDLRIWLALNRISIEKSHGYPGSGVPEKIVVLCNKYVDSPRSGASSPRITLKWDR